MDVEDEDGNRQLSYYTLPYCQEKHSSTGNSDSAIHERNQCSAAPGQQGDITNQVLRQTIILGLAEIIVI